MKTDPLQHALANQAGEEILRLVYGDDLAGCSVSLDGIASVVLGAMAEDAESKAGVLEVYEKAVEAVRVLSQPPADARINTPAELQALLSDRLDTIHQLAEKLTRLSAQAKGLSVDLGGRPLESGSEG